MSLSSWYDIVLMLAIESSAQEGPFLAGLRRSLRAESFFFPARFAILEEFLDHQVAEQLTHFVIERERDFTPSGVLHSDSRMPTISVEHRRSRVLSDLRGFRSIFLQRLQTALPSILLQFQIPPFPISAVDIQITATNDGEFFRPHTDSGPGPVARRTISYTYFFHQEPRRFTGGELCLYSYWRREKIVTAGCTNRILPKRNMIVFFPSDILHEIASVSCPSRQFRDSRFNVNGWIHR